jgi:hypothetical protein
MDTEILDLVAGVNPVPDESVLLPSEGDLESGRRLVTERSIMHPTIETKPAAAETAAESTTGMKEESRPTSWPAVQGSASG